MWEIIYQKTRKNFPVLGVKFNGVFIKTTEIEMFQKIGSLIHLKFSVVVLPEEIKFLDAREI